VVDEDHRSRGVAWPLASGSGLTLWGCMCPQCAPPAGMRTGRDGTKRDGAAERTDERSRR